MTCEEANGLLPWLLNGTLEAAEERQVREHLATCASCRAALAETRFAWRLFDEHVTTADLVAYAFDDRPPGADPALIERHVAECPRCAAELEMVRASRLLGEHEEVALLPRRTAAPTETVEAPGRFRAWRSGALAAGLVGVLALAGWLNSSQRVRTLESQLAADRGAGAPPAAAPAPVAPPAPGGGDRLAALETENRRLAAEVADARRQAEEQAGRVEELAQQVAARAASAAAGALAAVVELNPVERNVRGGGGGGEEARLPRLPGGAGRVALVLHSAAGDRGERRAEVVDPSGKVVARAAGLVYDPESVGYVLSLDASELAPGAYEIRLLDPTGRSVERFPFAF